MQAFDHEPGSPTERRSKKHRNAIAGKLQTKKIAQVVLDAEERRLQVELWNRRTQADKALAVSKQKATETEGVSEKKKKNQPLQINTGTPRSDRTPAICCYRSSLLR